MKRILLFVLCATAILTDGFTQQEKGTITGKITTTDNKPASSVTVFITENKKSAVADEDGKFVLHNIPAGNYSIEVSLIGYETLRQTVNIQAGKTTEVNLQLKLSEKELQEVVIRSGLGNYKTNNVSSFLRLQTPILEAPQNIQVISGKTLSDQQIISMSDGVLRNVSGTTRLEHWGDLYTNVNARGSQVQAFRNGFNVVSSYWGPLTEDMSFVDHIEFVKGPAGFMLSNGEASGLYNVVTKKPTGQTKGEAELTIGSFDLYRASLDLDGKLSKDGKLLYRLDLAGQQKGSHRPYEYNNRYTVAPVISYQVDDKTKVTLEYTYQNAGMSDLGSFYVFSTDGYATLPRDFTMNLPGLPPTKINDHSVYVNLQHQFNKDWKLTGQLAYFNYRQIGTDAWPSVVNPDGTIIRNVGLWDAKSEMSMGQVFVNGDVTTGAVHHRILAGVDVSKKYYIADWNQYADLDTQDEPFDVHNPYYGTPSNGYPVFDFSIPLEQRAMGSNMDQRYSGLYVQDELGFFDNKLRLTLAGRYTYVQQAEWGSSPYDAKHITPRIGLSYSIDKSTAAYALYDQAFTPQTGILTNGGKVKPITGSNIEFGIKKDWAGGRWNSTLAVYRIIKQHELTSDPNSPPTSGLSIEVGERVAQGIEFDLRGRITDGLNLVANYAYTDSKVTKVAEGVTDYKVGDKVPSYAGHTANAWLNYKIQSGALKGTGFSAGFTYLGDRHTNFLDPGTESIHQQLPDYFKLDAGIFWEKDRINITVNMFNVLNKYIYNGAFYSYNNAYYWQTDPPRNIRLSIRYRF